MGIHLVTVTKSKKWKEKKNMSDNYSKPQPTNSWGQIKQLLWLKLYCNCTQRKFRPLQNSITHSLWKPTSNDIQYNTMLRTE